MLFFFFIYNCFVLNNHADKFEIKQISGLLVSIFFLAVTIILSSMEQFNINSSSHRCPVIKNKSNFYVITSKLVFVRIRSGEEFCYYSEYRGSISSTCLRPTFTRAETKSVKKAAHWQKPISSNFYVQLLRQLLCALRQSANAKKSIVNLCALNFLPWLLLRLPFHAFKGCYDFCPNAHFQNTFIQNPVYQNHYIINILPKSNLLKSAFLLIRGQRVLEMCVRIKIVAPFKVVIFSW